MIPFITTERRSQGIHVIDPGLKCVIYTAGCSPLQGVLEEIFLIVEP